MYLCGTKYIEENKLNGQTLALLILPLFLYFKENNILILTFRVLA